MRLLKPSWVEHGGQRVFSLDIHPDGRRFVTAGGDQLVRKRPWLASCAPLDALVAQSLERDVLTLLAAPDCSVTGEGMGDGARGGARS